MEYTNKDQYLEKLINKYSNMVYRLALVRTKTKENSEDIYQEVFLKLAKKMPNFQSEEHEKAWLIRVTINCSKSFLNSKFIENTVELKEEIPLQTEERHDVYYAVQKLPLKYRTIIHLFYYENYRIKEIGKILKMNENTVKTYLARAREKLKLEVEEEIK